MGVGDLIYYPAGTMLIQYNKEIENLELDPNKTYIGPSPIKYKKLEKPTNAIMLDEDARDNCSKIWFEGEEWYVEK